MPDEQRVLPVTSSQPPDFLPEALECYRGVLESLNEAGIAYAIAGAFALHRHTGIWRATKDLDVFLEAKSVPETLLRLRQLGFKTHIQDPIWLAKAWRGEYFVDLITALGNAVLIVNATWLERATMCDVLGVSCPVLGAEEMIASKLFILRRERFDGADVVHLLRACGRRLDWDRLEELLGDHWELLMWAMVLFAYVYPSRVGDMPRQLWSSLMRRFEEHLDHPGKDEPFRGSLLDPNMFAIDVADWGERDLMREYVDRHPALLQATEPEESI